MNYAVLSLRTRPLSKIKIRNVKTQSTNINSKIYLRAMTLHHNQWWTVSMCMENTRFFYCKREKYLTFSFLCFQWIVKYNSLLFFFFPKIVFFFPVLAKKNKRCWFVHMQVFGWDFTGTVELNAVDCSRNLADENGGGFYAVGVGVVNAETTMVDSKAGTGGCICECWCQPCLCFRSNKIRMIHVRSFTLT